MSKDLIKKISQFLELMCARYWFMSEFCLLEIQTNYKNWVWKEKLGLEPSMCSHSGWQHMWH
jgi:hypothetical protein